MNRSDGKYNLTFPDFVKSLIFTIGAPVFYNFTISPLSLPIVQ